MNKGLKNIIILLVCVISGGTAVAQMSYIVPVPPQPSTITGSTCVASITYPPIAYSVDNVPGTTYEWTLPAGWTQVSGGNTNSITVKPGGATSINVTISVSAKNNFGKSIPRVLSNIYYQDVPMPTFASRNLGADPMFDDPKSQMQYLASSAFTTNLQRAYDGRVYGGRYQWGRHNNGNYAINPSTYEIYNSTGLLNRHSYLEDGATYDTTTGQILTNPNSIVGGTDYSTNNADTVFVSPQSGTGRPIYYDWRMSSTANGAGQNNKLWGNGVAININTNSMTEPGIRRSDGNYYQGTSWVIPENNPCPTSWRVPTQDEFKRLLNYDCNGQNTANTQSNANLSIPTTTLWGTTNTGFTWVRVSNGLPFKGTWSVGGSTTGNGNGFAIYRTDDWNAAIAAGGYLEGLQQDGTGLVTTKKLYDTDAPEPFLFLPATGFRQYTGTGQSAATNGYYSTATINGSNIYELQFSSSSITISITNYRGSGDHIRCVK